MEDERKALTIVGMVGAVTAIVGFAGFFVGGDFWAFMSGAMPGIQLGLSLLVLLVITRANGRA